jgi:hypothetical protein
VEHVEEPMAGERDDDQPEVPAKADDGDRRQHGESQNLPDQRLGGTAHHGEEDIVGPDRQGYGGIERALPVQSCDRSTQRHPEREHQSNKKFQREILSA